MNLPAQGRKPSSTAAVDSKASTEVLAPTSSPSKLSAKQWQVTLAATDELRYKLRRLSQTTRIALGHQDSTAYGVGWYGDSDRSDVKSVCGDYPAVHGWDLFGIELGRAQNGDGVGFALMCKRMQEAHRRGGINTVSWHAYNPVTGKDAWDVRKTAPDILPGGNFHQTFLQYLDRVADFFEDCRGEQGELLPVIFRPLHEHTGGWFWWGANTTTPEEYTALFRLVVNHLRTTRKLQQLLFAVSPSASHVRNTGEYLARYPGDESVDVLGVDCYYEKDASILVEALETAVGLAKLRGKVAALTEFGIEGGLSTRRVPVEHWFTRSFLAPLQRSPTASHIAYALTWRNARTDHCFAAYPSHPSANDFRRLCEDPNVLLESELARALAE